VEAIFTLQLARWFSRKTPRLQLKMVCKKLELSHIVGSNDFSGPSDKPLKNTKTRNFKCRLHSRLVSRLLAISGGMRYGRYPFVAKNRDIINPYIKHTLQGIE